MTPQTVAGTRTAGDSPDDVQLNPQLRKAASPLSESINARNYWYVLKNRLKKSNSVLNFSSNIVADSPVQTADCRVTCPRLANNDCAGCIVGLDHWEI